jgi:prepilin-type N-terminal cleavage/methylation domain-containing protein
VRRGLSIVELLIVVLVLAVLATAALTYSGSGTPELLEAAAECVIGDLELARSLAVSNSSNYRITFDTSQSQYSLRHAGSNAALDILPASPFHRASDGGKCLTAELADLPSLEGDVQLLAVQKDPASPVDVTDVEFDPLGSTTRTEETIIWLAAGHGSQRRYLSIRINPTTGLAQSGDPQPQQPAGVVDVLAQAVLGP